jgi:manganese/zinc/iron transport system ATP- binding protein
MPDDSLSKLGIALETHDLTVAYDKKPVLYGIDVRIEPGQLVGIMGPNGAGKSTLIKAIMGLLKPASGWIQIFGESNISQRNRIAYVPQRREVDWDFPVTVMDVVLMGRYGHLGLFKRPGKKDLQIALDSLEKVNMIPFADRQISNLSGGQQQRVFLARALAQQSDLYLMDEPFVGVDAATESTIIDLLQELRSEGKTLLVVHHDLPTARHYFDSLLLLNMRLVAYGPVKDIFQEELLQRTYGGRLTILSEVADAVGIKAKVDHPSP